MCGWIDASFKGLGSVPKRIAVLGVVMWKSLSRTASPGFLFCQSSYKVYRRVFAQSDNSTPMNLASPGLDPSIEWGWPSEA